MESSSVVCAGAVCCEGGVAGADCSLRSELPPNVNLSTFTSREHCASPLFLFIQQRASTSPLTAATFPFLMYGASFSARSRQMAHRNQVDLRRSPSLSFPLSTAIENLHTATPCG